MSEQNERDEIRDLMRKRHKLNDQELMPEAIVEASSDLPTNKVRVYRLDVRQSVVINGFKYEPGLHVWIKEMPDKEWQIFAIGVAASTRVFGEGTAARTIPPGGQETVAWSIPALGLTEGRLSASRLGGLYVHTEAFTYDGGYHPGGSFGGGSFAPTTYDESIATYLPSTSGNVCWIARYFDPTDASFHFVKGVDEFQDGNPAYLNEADIAGISIPSGCYPLGAVAVAYGQTTVQGARFASARWFLGKKEIEISQIMTDGRGFAMTDGRGYFMLGAH